MSEKWQDRLNRLAGEEVNRGEEFAESFARRDTGNDYSVDFERRRFRAVTKTDRSVETLSGGARQGGKSASIEDMIDSIDTKLFNELFHTAYANMINAYFHATLKKNAPTPISDQETEGSD